jgi:hypothetical protein
MNKDIQEKESQLMKSRSGRACIREGYQLFTSHFRRIFKITWPMALFFAVISATAASLPVLVSPALLWPAFGIEAVAVILLLVIAYRRLVKKQFFEQLSKTVSKRRGVWLHHLGIELLVWTFCLLVILSLSIVTTLPMLIVMAANWINQAGTLSGDPNGMPAYMTWLTVIVFLIAGFIQAYVWLTLLAPLYLMHGSIAQKEKEREEFKKKAKKINNQKYEQNLIYRP